MEMKKTKTRPGMTMIEMMVTTCIAMIVIFGLGVYIVGMHRGYWSLYKNVHGDLVRDTYVARRAFDGMVRKGAGRYAVNSEGDSIAIAYWSAGSAEKLPDCEDVFSVVEKVVEGEPKKVLELKSGPVGSPVIETICTNVSDCVFYVTGDSVQMMLTFEEDKDSSGDEVNSVRVFSSAVQHN